MIGERKVIGLTYEGKKAPRFQNQEAQNNMIVKLYLEGMAQVDIADQLDISNVTVQSAIRHKGVEIDPKVHENRLRYAKGKKTVSQIITINGKKYSDVTAKFGF